MAVHIDNIIELFLLCCVGGFNQNQHIFFMRVLGIETSCDDTGAAVYDGEHGLLSHKLASQIDTHQPYGGVVPELAARDHIRSLLPLIESVLKESCSDSGSIDGVAYTAGPGLVGALLVGASIGRSLAWAWGVPAVGVHHMEGHLLAPMLEERVPQFPFVALLVSGGHTLLADVKRHGQYQILGSTVDDAVGEAFDKTAKMLGLPYPGGPAISRLAKSGRHGRYQFPRPMTDRPGFEFSFSGLKTFALNTFSKDGEQAESLGQTKADIAYAFQDAAVATLIIKSRRAIQHTGYKSLVIAGGVGANETLRNRVCEIAHKENFEAFYPRPEFCTDNGAMIAYAGYLRLIHGHNESLSFDVKPRWSLHDLETLNG